MVSEKGTWGQVPVLTLPQSSRCTAGLQGPVSAARKHHPSGVTHKGQPWASVPCFTLGRLHSSQAQSC